MNTPLLLEIKDLRISFSDGKNIHSAVDGVHFFIAPGETLGVVGESGSGKSLTALSLMQLLPQGAERQGQALWQSESDAPVDLFSLSEAHARRYRGREMSMIFQEPMTSLNPVFTCGEQVCESLRLHLGLPRAQAREQALAWFSRVKLPDPLRIFKAYPHQLSGGQRQRVMIAMAMCTSPRLLIADEPTTALDVTVQATILDLIEELKAETGAAVLFISHDLGVVRGLAQRVMVMQHGRIVEQGETRRVFEQPTHPYTQGLLACRPPVKHALRRLPVIDDFMPDAPVAPAPVANVLGRQLLPDAEIQQRRTQIDTRPLLLDARGLQVWFPRPTAWWKRQPDGWVKAVDGVALQLRPGESLGIVGESGSGKTTLGRSLVRLAPLRQGEIYFKGEAIHTLPSHEFATYRPKMQMVFQDPYGSLNPAMTIGQMLAEPLRINRSDISTSEMADRVALMLQRVGLNPAHANRFAREFSGGQRQRIGIARALMVEPELLICDESVSALDVSVQAHVLNLLKDLQDERGFSLIFISHDLSVIRFISDQVMVMHQGKAVECARPEDIISRPREAYTQQLIAAVPQ
jgi:peptide/nickel transport system ATP-binding protein